MDDLDAEFERMKQLLQQKQQRIDDLQWRLAEAQARLHVVKTHGVDKDTDPALMEKTTQQYFKKNFLVGCRTDARMQQLSAVGEIHSLFDLADNTAFCLDDEQDAAAKGDLLAGVAAEKRLTRSGLAVRAGECETQESQLLAREQLVGKTAIAEPGLRFSYVLLLLQENGRWLPSPIGRFGEPFWKGSSWESFDPRRLYVKGRADYVAPTPDHYQQLAQDASLISFAFRSSTQRNIVSSAPQRGAGIISSHEPDVVSMCRTNPARLPSAIRRQYRRGPTGAVFYTEYDAADIGNQIVLSMSGPQKTARRDREHTDQKRACMQAVERCVLDWAPLVAGELAGREPAELASAVRPWAPGAAGGGHELDRMVWDHLTANGLPPRSLLPGCDFHDYIRRGRFLERERRRMTERYREEMGPDHGGNQTDERRWPVADRVPYEPVPDGFPVVRVRLQKEKVQELAQKYRERRNARAFMPL